MSDNSFIFCFVVLPAVMLSIFLTLAIYNHNRTTDKQVCMTKEEVRSAVYSFRDEIIENELLVKIVGDEYHPAVKPPPMKPEGYKSEK